VLRKLNRIIKTSPVAFLLLLEVILGTFISAGSILLFLTLRSEVLEKDFVGFDNQILRLFYQFRSPLLNQLMQFFSYLGGEVLVGGAILVTVVLLLKKHKREAFLFSFILGMAALIDNLLKNLTQRTRPQYFPLIIERDYSFPSGHAMDSFVFYATLAYLTFHLTKNKKLSFIISIIAIFIILLIGVSRIYLGVHYPSDVLAGYLGGLGWFTGILLIEKTLVLFKLFRENSHTD